MSATAPMTLDVSQTRSVPFDRMLSVELRKMADTRAGFWLLLSTGLLLAATMVIALLVIVLNDLDPTYQTWAGTIMVIPLSLLMPVFAITTVTSEWGQRTGLVTFTHVPHRGRVLAAKLVVVVGLAASTIALALGLAAIGLFLQGALGSAEARWTIDGSALLWTFLTQVLYFLMAFGVGLVFLNSAGAIAVYYVVALLLPFLVWGPIYGLVSWGPDVIPWIDIGFATGSLTDQGMEAQDNAYAQIVMATLIWVATPNLVGIRRWLRAEVK